MILIIFGNADQLFKLFGMRFTRSVDQALPVAGKPLLLALPGAGCSPAIYDAVEIEGWDTWAIDWSNGPGPVDPLSVAHRLGALLRRREAPTAIAGHSAGAAIAALTASLHPTDVCALVVSNTGLNSRRHGDPTLVERIRARWGAPERDAFLLSCFHTVPAPALLDTLRRYLADLPVDALLESIEGLRALDLQPYLDDIRVPTLIAHGERDTRRRVEDAHDLASAIPGARLQLLPGGHTPMVDCPREYTLVVERMLRQSQPA